MKISPKFQTLVAPAINFRYAYAAMDLTNEKTVQTERQKAKELRKSRWWQNRISNQATCYYCSVSLNPADVTMDHLVPLTAGGRSTKDNIVISCWECNQKKKDQSIIDLMLAQANKVSHDS